MAGHVVTAFANAYRKQAAFANAFRALVGARDVGLVVEGFALSLSLHFLSWLVP